MAVLDIYHGAAHLAEAARRVVGEGNPEAEARGGRATLRLLGDGPWGVAGWVGEIGGRIPAGATAQRWERR